MLRCCPSCPVPRLAHTSSFFPNRAPSSASRLTLGDGGLSMLLGELITAARLDSVASHPQGAKAAVAPGFLAGYEFAFAFSI
jgi:hypothetical protein